MDQTAFPLLAQGIRPTIKLMTPSDNSTPIIIKIEMSNLEDASVFTIRVEGSMDDKNGIVGEAEIDMSNVKSFNEGNILKVEITGSLVQNLEKINQHILKIKMNLNLTGSITKEYSAVEFEGVFSDKNMFTNDFSAVRDIRIIQPEISVDLGHIDTRGSGSPVATNNAGDKQSSDVVESVLLIKEQLGKSPALPSSSDEGEYEFSDFDDSIKLIVQDNMRKTVSSALVSDSTPLESPSSPDPSLGSPLSLDLDSESPLSLDLELDSPASLDLELESPLSPDLDSESTLSPDCLDSERPLSPDPALRRPLSLDLLTLERPSSSDLELGSLPCRGSAEDEDPSNDINHGSSTEDSPVRPARILPSHTRTDMLGNMEYQIHNSPPSPYCDPFYPIDNGSRDTLMKSPDPVSVTTPPVEIENANRSAQKSCVGLSKDHESLKDFSPLLSLVSPVNIGTPTSLGSAGHRESYVINLDDDNPFIDLTSDSSSNSCVGTASSLVNVDNVARQNVISLDDDDTVIDLTSDSSSNSCVGTPPPLGSAGHVARQNVISLDDDDIFIDLTSDSSSSLCFGTPPPLVSAENTQQDGETEALFTELFGVCDEQDQQFNTGGNPDQYLVLPSQKTLDDEQELMPLGINVLTPKAELEECYSVDLGQSSQSSCLTDSRGPSGLRKRKREPEDNNDMDMGDLKFVRTRTDSEGFDIQQFLRTDSEGFDPQQCVTSNCEEGIMRK